MSVCGTIFPLNVALLLVKVAEKVDSWCRLPLTVVGRSNLIKMILMLPILYIGHNTQFGSRCISFIDFTVCSVSLEKEIW